MFPNRRAAEIKRENDVWMRENQRIQDERWEAHRSAEKLLDRLLRQGTQVALGANMRLLVRPGPGFGDADRAAIRKHRALILEMLGGEGGVEVF